MHQLGIGARIFAFQAVVAAAVLLMAGGVFVAFQSLNHFSQRSAWSREQLDEITELDAGFNRYSEQIAELLLIGEPERRDFESARAAFQDDLDELAAATAGERAFLSDSAEAAAESLEQERLDQIDTLYKAMNAEAERLFALRRAGEQDEAVRQFRLGIEDRLDAELEALVAAAVEDEIEEVRAADEQVEGVMRSLTLVVASALFVALAASLGFGALLYGSLARPIRKLTQGAIALGYGDLSYRVGDLGGDELGLLAARFDDMASQLTDQRRLLLESQSDLETQVSGRTAELERVNQRLRELDRARVQLFADISHELRTPLTVLRGEAEVTLRARALPEAAARESLERIADQAREMTRLVDDLMFLARSEADEIRFEREHFDLADILAESIDEAQVLGRARNVRIRRVGPAGSAAIAGDRQRLKQTLMIVLDNAAKYSPPGSIASIELAAHAGEATVTVRNRSGGIVPDDLPFLFDRFYRGRSGQAASGSGLGLPIARSIVEKHGGSISLASAADGFVEVKLRLPVDGDKVVETAASADPARAAG